MTEAMARRILQAALFENRAGALLDCLFEGGSCTVDPNGDLVLIDGDVLASLGASDDA